MNTQARSLKVGNLTINTGKREVKKSGETIKLTRLSYQLLIVLVESAPNVVTHEQLLEQVWPGRVVSPETLTQRVKLLRQAIGDDAQSPSYIGLVRGEGYRLLPNVQLLREELELHKNDNTVAPFLLFRQKHSFLPKLTVAVILAVVVALFYAISKQNNAEDFGVSIAVLPFRNLSGDVNDDYIVDGFGSELLDQLGRVPGLRVVARASTVAVSQHSEEVVSIAEQLGVGRVIQGSLRRQGNNLHITIHIINGENGFQLWSQSYDRSSRDLLAIQQKIASDVTRRLLPESENPASVPVPTTLNVSAHDLLLLARFYENKVRDSYVVDVELLDKSIELYRRATETDPESALAHSRYGAALLYGGYIDAAEEPIFRALKLEPQLAEVQTTLGSYYWIKKLPGSSLAWEKAIELNPNDADALASYAFWVWNQGHPNAPQPYYERALAIDPLSLQRHADLGNFYAMTGKVVQAEEAAERIKTLFQDAQGYSLLARIYEQLGQVDVAIAWAKKANSANPGRQDYLWQIAEMYAIAGDFESALQVEPRPGMGVLFRMRRYSDMIDLGQDLMLDFPTDEKLKYLLAFAYNAEGRYKEAIRVLKLAGLPERATTDTRRPTDIEALNSLAIAYYETGEIEKARPLAQWVEAFGRKYTERGAIDWWGPAYGACSLRMLGEPNKARGLLLDVNSAARLPWMPFLKDAPCFAPFRGTPEYQGMLKTAEDTRTALRAKLQAIH